MRVDILVGTFVCYIQFYEIQFYIIKNYVEKIDEIGSNCHFEWSYLLHLRPSYRGAFLK